MQIPDTATLDPDSDQLKNIESLIRVMRHGNTLSTLHPKVYCSIKSIYRATGLSLKEVRLIAANNLFEHDGIRNSLSSDDPKVKELKLRVK